MLACARESYFACYMRLHTQSRLAGVLPNPIVLACVPATHQNRVFNAA